MVDYEASPPYVSEELPEDHPHFVLIGECKAHPPRLISLAIQEDIDVLEKNHGLTLRSGNLSPRLSGSMCPVTWESEWCGEWQPIPAAGTAPEAAPAPAVLMHVRELGLDGRGRKLCNRLGVESVGLLILYTADQLLEGRNFGMTSLGVLRKALAKHGLKLRGD